MTTQTQRYAKKLVVKAWANPKNWRSDGKHHARIMFANGIYTIGKHDDDLANYTTADDALTALIRQWELEDQK